MPPPTDLRLSRLAYAAFAERLQAETGDGRTPTPRLLDDCGTLTGTADPEVVTFIQILPLVASRLGKPSRPLVPPTRLLQLVHDGGKSVQVFQSSAARLTAAATGAQSPEAPDVRRPPVAIRPYARPSPLGSLLTDHDRPAALTPLGVGDAADAGLAFGGLRVGRRPSAGFPSMLLPALLRREVALPIPLLPTRLRPGPAVFEAVWDGLNQLIQLHLATHPSSNPHWAVAVDYEQVWDRVAYRRGRLLGSIPLTPSESAEIVVKTWERRSERRTTVEAIEENTSTEVVGDERWSAATAKEIAMTSASTLDVSAGIDGGVTLPVQGSPVSIGGNLGINASFAEQLSRRTQRTAERTQQLTVKTVSGLKSTRTQTIELAHETGTETTATQRLTNLSPCGTLTYHFFEVVEEYVVTTRPVRATPLLLVPLTVPAFDVAEVLCRRCEIRRLLPCEALYAGLAGAKSLAVAAKLGVSVASLRAEIASLKEAETAGRPSSPLMPLVDQVLARVAAFEAAEIPGLGALLPAGGDLPELLTDLAQQIARTWDDLATGLEEIIGKGAGAAEHFFEAIREAASGNFADAANAEEQGRQAATDAVNDFGQTVANALSVVAQSVGQRTVAVTSTAVGEVAGLRKAISLPPAQRPARQPVEWNRARMDPGRAQPLDEEYQARLTRILQHEFSRVIALTKQVTAADVRRLFAALQLIPGDQVADAVAKGDGRRRGWPGPCPTRSTSRRLLPSCRSGTPRA